MISAGWGPAECTVLEVARVSFKHPGTRDQVIRDVLDVSSTIFFSLLGEIIDRPEAAAYDGQLVNRLRRVRDNQHAHRAARRLS